MTEKKTRPYKNPQINLRIPEDLKERVQKIADKNGRSMNAEILIAINEYLLKYLIDDESEKKLNTIILKSIDQKSSTPKDIKGALEILKLIDNQTNDYRSKLLNGFLEFASDSDKK